MAMLEARLRLEMEAMGRQIEERFERQVAAARGLAGPTTSTSGFGSSGSGGLPASADALLGAKLRQLEGQVSGLAFRQDDAEKLAVQVTGLQELVNKVAEEVVRIKGRADSAASTAASAVAAASAATAAAGSAGGAAPAVEERFVTVAVQVSGLQETVTALRREMQTMSSRVDALVGQVSACRMSQSELHHHAKDVHQMKEKQLALVEDLQQLAAKVEVIPTDVVKGGPGFPTSAQLEALEKKVASRLTRYDGALLQVAKQVDVLDMRLREEQEGNMKTIEALLLAAGGPHLQKGTAGVQDSGLSIESK